MRIFCNNTKVSRSTKSPKHCKLGEVLLTWENGFFLKGGVSVIILGCLEIRSHQSIVIGAPSSSQEETTSLQRRGVRNHQDIIMIMVSSSMEKYPLLVGEVPLIIMVSTSHEKQPLVKRGAFEIPVMPSSREGLLASSLINIFQSRNFKNH